MYHLAIVGPSLIPKARQHCNNVVMIEQETRLPTHNSFKAVKQSSVCITDGHINQKGPIPLNHESPISMMHEKHKRAEILGYITP